MMEYDRDPQNFKPKTNMGDLLELENIIKDMRTELGTKRVTLAGRN